MKHYIMSLCNLIKIHQLFIQLINPIQSAYQLIKKNNPQGNNAITVS